MVGDTDMGDLRISSYGGKELTRPVPLRTFAAELGVAMRRRSTATPSVWGPHDDPERDAHRLLLIALDDDLQDYHLGRPMPVADLPGRTAVRPIGRGPGGGLPAPRGPLRPVVDVG